jgi:hypothetical protein
LLSRVFWDKSAAIIRIHFRNGFKFKFQSALCELRLTGKADERFQPEEYIRYFEDSANASLRAETESPLQ